MTEAHLPVRTSHRAVTLQRWHTMNLALLERVAAGLRALDYPEMCRSTAAPRGYAHAHQIAATHAKHRCPRYRLAADYTMEARP